MNPISPDRIAALTDVQVDRIVKSYLLESKESAYRSGKVALADALGRSMDYDELEAVEDAARRRSADTSLRSAISYAFLAYLYPGEIVSIEHAAITKPWNDRA